MIWPFNVMAGQKPKVQELRDGKTLCQMSCRDKKRFLSMDLIERMIRIEQKVAASFGKHITYNQTEYYRGLPASEKQAFENYLKKNRRKKFLLGLILLIPLAFLVSLRTEITSEVVRDTIGDKTLVSLMENAFAVFIMALCALFLIALIFRKLKNRRFDRHFDVLDKIISEKHKVKKGAHI